MAPRAPLRARSLRGPLTALLAIAWAASCSIDQGGGLTPESDASASGGNAGTNDAAFPDAASDAGQDDVDATASDDVLNDVSDANDDGDGDAESDVADAAPCDGVLVGGYCWYASEAGKSCDERCLSHGGCDLAGTRDYAGSGGSDANCLAVLNALGYGNYNHQAFCNNDLGCQFAWASWTYWSTYYPTTCEAAGPGAAAVERMCACNQ